MAATAPGRRRRVAATLTCVALLLGACGSEGGEESYEGRCRNGADAAAAEAPEITVPDEPADELVVEDLIEGCGPEVASGAITAATVHYAGRSQSTGVEFDSSWARSEPATFDIGAGRLIAGWDEGLVGMKEGGRRQLTIPGELAYGPEGRPPDIGPDDTLVFVIDLIGATERAPVTTTTAPEVTMSTSPDAPADCRDAGGAEIAEEPEVDLPAEAATEVIVTDLIIGCGDEIPESGAQVTVDYVGRALSSGKVFDSSYDDESPANFLVGAGGLIAGWEHGLTGMKVGGRRTIVVPGAAAYGEAGRPPDIGPDDTLVFVIDLIQVQA